MHFICLLLSFVIFPLLYCPQIVSFKYLSAFVVITASNEVWGKVIFSQVCVITSVHGGVGVGGVVSQHAMGRGMYPNL